MNVPYLDRSISETMVMPPGFQNKRRSKKSNDTYSSNIFFNNNNNNENKNHHQKKEQVNNIPPVINGSNKNDVFKLPLHLLNQQHRNDKSNIINDSAKRTTNRSNNLSSYRTNTIRSMTSTERSFNNHLLRNRAREIVHDQTVQLKKAINESFHSRQLKNKTITLLEEQVERLKEERKKERLL